MHGPVPTQTFICWCRPAMSKDGPTVRIKGMQTLAYQRGKLALVTFEQRTRSGGWRERTREKRAGRVGRSDYLLAGSPWGTAVALPLSHDCTWAM